MVEKLADALNIFYQEPLLISFSLYYVLIAILLLVYIWKQTFSPISPLRVTNTATGICLVWDFVINAFGDSKETSISFFSRVLWLISFAFLVNLLLIVYHRLMLKNEEEIKPVTEENDQMITKEHYPHDPLDKY